MGTQNEWVFKLVGSQKCRSSKSMNTQKLNFVDTQICGYSKFMDTQNLLILKICWLLNLWVIKKYSLRFLNFVGIQNLLILEICGH